MSETLNFTKLADAPMLETVPDGATAYAEVDGKVYRVPGDSLGGGGGIKTAIVQLNMVQETSSDSSMQYTGTCQNMTFDEAKAILMDGQPLAIMLLMDIGPLMGADTEMPASWYADGCTYMSNDVAKTTSMLSDGGSSVIEGILIQHTFSGSIKLLYWIPDNSITSAI